MHPTDGAPTLVLFVDADFCGLHGREEDTDQSAAKSRAGYIVMFNNCPVYWKSQLISSICLSTLEAEYCALSNALKTMLPIKHLLEEILGMMSVDSNNVSATVQARVFEDNQGALLLARNHRVTNRTKYFLVKWHWFWAHANELEFIKVESRNQRADFLTKGLPRDVFEHNRRLTIGW